MTTIRTFIAFDIEVNSLISENLIFIKNKLQEEKIKWENNTKFHITIAFLGDTPKIQLEQINSVIKKNTDKYKNFEVKINKFGIFPNIQNPKIIWLGIDYTNTLDELQKNIKTELNKLGFKIDNRPFKPHLTIGRVKDQIKNTATINELIKKYQNTIFNQQNINQIIFYESNLTPKGSIYNVLNTFNLSQ